MGFIGYMLSAPAAKSRMRKAQGTQTTSVACSDGRRRHRQRHPLDAINASTVGTLNMGTWAATGE